VLWSSDDFISLCPGSPAQWRSMAGHMVDGIIALPARADMRHGGLDLKAQLSPVESESNGHFSWTRMEQMPLLLGLGHPIPGRKERINAHTDLALNFSTGLISPSVRWKSNDLSRNTAAVP